MIYFVFLNLHFYTRYFKYQYQQSMQKQQKNKEIQCQTCGESIPKSHFDIHTFRCNMKKQSILMGKTSRLSSSKGFRKPKIFQQKKVQISKEPQQKIPCPLCGYMQTFMQLDTHPDKCAGKQSNCQFCGDFYPSELMQEHKAVCEANQNINESEGESGNILENPIQRLMRLIDILNNIGALMHNMQLQGEEGLSEKDIKELKSLHYRPGKEEQICTICYCKFQKNEDCLELKCKHIYHNQCISKWLQKSSKCPLCKHDQKLPK